MSKMCLIVAVAVNGVIGNGNQLPWRLPRDLTFFKETTMGHAIIMGRKTYQSIGRPLPGRVNVVLSSHQDVNIGSSVVHVNTYERAISVGRSVAVKSGRFFVIGGGQVYARAIQDADVLYVTHIDKVVPGDAFFPAIDPAVWRAAETLDEYFDDGLMARVQVVRYERQ